LVTRRDRFKAQNGLTRGTAHAGLHQFAAAHLGLGLGADHDGEFVNINGERVHIFECFALVNFLLCSAVPAAEEGAKATHRLAGKPVRSTKTMQANCSSHFRAALEILEPTLVVAQGYGVCEWIASAYGSIGATTGRR